MSKSVIKEDLARKADTISESNVRFLLQGFVQSKDSLNLANELSATRSAFQQEDEFSSRNRLTMY